MHRDARNESIDGLARSENGSEFQSTMVSGKKEYLSRSGRSEYQLVVRPGSMTTGTQLTNWKLETGC